MAKKSKDAYLTKNFICVKDEKGESTYYLKTKENIKQVKVTCGSVRKGRNSKKLID